MFTFIFLFLLLNIPLLVARFIHPSCFWRLKQNEDMNEDLEKGCLFLLSAVQLSVEKDYFNHFLNIKMPTKIYPYAMALAFSLNEVNRKSDLLPNISLVFDFQEDGCMSLPELESFIYLSQDNGAFPLNYICGEENSWTVVLTGPRWKTSVLQLTYGPFHPILSDHEQFSCLYQMALKDTSLVMAMVSFIIYFHWNWVGLAISDNDQGIQFLSHLRTEMEKNAVCFSFVNMIPVDIPLYMSKAGVYYNQVLTSSTNVIIIYGDSDTTLALSFRTWESLGIQRLWVTTSQWDVTTSKRDFNLDSFPSTFVFTHKHAEITGIKNFVQSLNPLKYSHTYLARLEWMAFSCDVSASNCKNLKNCSYNASLEWLMEQTFEMAFSDGSYDIYNAVYAVAHAFHEMIFQRIDNSPKDNNIRSKSPCLELHSFLKKTNFINPVGDRVYMNEKEKLQAEYDIFQVWNFPHILELKVKIGKFSPYFPKSQQLVVSEDIIEWATGGKQMPPSICSPDCGPGLRKFWKEGMAACCFDCVPCLENEISNETNVDHCLKCEEDQYANTEHNHCIHRAVVFLSYEEPLGMTLALMALCFSVFTAVALGIFVKHHNTPIVKANNRSLSYILLSSLIFSFLCSFLFIGHPNSVTCLLQQITFGLVFTVAVSTVLAKTVTVVLAFNVIVPERRMRHCLVSGLPNYIILTCILIQIILCAIWLGISPPFIERDAFSEHGKIIIFCNKGSIISFYSVLGYQASLALGTFIMAYLARNLPDTFNEAKFLTFSMLLFCSVWVTFLPVYYSTKGKFMVAVEVFSILASSAGLLGCIFIPKCYIILLRPERNSLQKLRWKGSS
ncbi:vomeronasal type-2 receptor 116-like isoform X2 [Mus pahari]|uniref:vomeronasal type-2 receptor 116-like isoform X2 n=1 Tax=Mus pahari TaxID=10093 RepID=UPI001114D283|nr:vomeronasal type-2 receptor 116-like isoform X2 [Mus pahari]